MFGKPADVGLSSPPPVGFMSGLLDFSHGLPDVPFSLPDLAADYGPSSNWFAPAACTWLALTYTLSRIIGKRFEWKPVQARRANMA